jgi:hypothetical protein
MSWLPTTVARKINPAAYRRALLARDPVKAALMDNTVLQEYLASSFASRGGYSKWHPSLKAGFDSYLLSRIGNQGLLDSPGAYREFLKGWGPQIPA